ncbi:MAG: hypothetical protein KDK36_13505 [Leptospiraceae bacterium]|nr:hypothetical protein [Leptospiraceae bacterium]
MTKEEEHWIKIGVGTLIGLLGAGLSFFLDRKNKKKRDEGLSDIGFNNLEPMDSYTSSDDSNTTD